MRILFILLLTTFVACSSETEVATTKVMTQVDIKLPANALYGNISAFSGLHAAVPDLFVEELVEAVDGKLHRTLTLSNKTILVDQLLETDDDQRLIRYKTISTSLPAVDMTHMIQIVELSRDVSQATWTSMISAQNQHRDFVDKRMKGIQESYLFSLELLGEELDQMMNDPEF